MLINKVLTAPGHRSSWEFRHQYARVVRY